jgi:hypothetical protein
MAEIRINTTGGLKLYDADNSHYAQIVAGTITSNVDAITLGHNLATFNAAVTATGILKTDDTTEATSTTDGSLQTDGGLSVAKDTVMGDDLKLLSDSSVIHFGANSEVTLTHSHDAGLNLKHTATADDKPVVLTLQTGETDMAADDVIGKIAFQAPDESTGTDAILISAAIQAVAEGNHSSSSNATRLEFMTGASEAATQKMTLSSAGLLRLGGSTSPDAAADNLVMQGSGDTGMSIFSGGSDKASIFLGTDGANNDCRLIYDNDANSIHLYGNAAEVMKVNGNGSITKPLQPCFLGRIGSDQSISATSATTLTIDTERFDQNADFNTGTYTFTAPVTGRYMFSAFASYNALTAGTYVSLFIETSNATYHAVGDVSGNSFNSQSITIVADMDTNDTALLKNETQGDSSYTARGGTATFFSGCLLA